MHVQRNILIVNYYYPPINNGGVQRIINFKKQLEKHGFHVTIVTTNSYGILQDDFENNIYRFPDSGYDYTNNTNASSIGRYCFRAFRRFLVYMGLILDGKYYWKKNVIKGLNTIILSHSIDLVIASYPTPVNLEIGEYIYKKFSIPLVVDYRDGLMFEPFLQYKYNTIFFKNRLTNLEKRMSNIAVLHLTVNDDMNYYYQKTYPNVKSIVIANGFDDEEEIIGNPIEMKDGINVLYTGSIGKSRVVYDFDTIATILDKIFKANDSINFMFIGDFFDYELEFFSKYNNVSVHEKVDRQTILATQQKADSFLLISGPNGGTSGKLYEYLFAKKPILNIGGNRGIAKIINGKNYGITCSPEQIDDMCKFLTVIAQYLVEYIYPSHETFTRRYQCKKLADELDELFKI